MIHMSSLFYDSFIEKLEEAAAIGFETHKGRLYTKCRENFPSLFFLIDGHFIEIAAKDYVIDVSRG